MTEYITQEQAITLADKHNVPAGITGGNPSKSAVAALCNAAIQTYRDSLVAGVVLPEIGPHDHPEPQTHVWTNLEIQAIQDYARQAIADALAKQVPQCVCGENTLGVVHRNDGPCYWPTEPHVAIAAFAAAPDPKEQQ